VGDLAGIMRRLDYVRSLGVDAVWLSPIFPSPMADFGYDVADYTDIHPLFGDLSTFDRLLAEAHKRGLKLLLDLVPNHTSDQHPWFLESRSSRANPKRDWYIWRDASPMGGLSPEAGPPNNWLSFFGGPAWTFDEATGQYYLHQFLSQQPELNYRNPDVVAALEDTLRFWLDRGVDGFRVDVMWLMIKDPTFRDEPADPRWDGVNPHNSLQHIYTADQPEVHEIVRRMRRVLDAYDDRMMVGEIYLPNEQLVTYYGRGDESHLPFNFQLIDTPWKADVVRRAVDAYEVALPPDAWPNWVLSNHDRHRVATRIGAAQARVANMLLLTLRGTPTTYYGEELGMENVPIPPEFVQDPPALRQPEIAHVVGRDPVRTPMQWDDSPNASFAMPGVTPWLPLAADYRDRNVAAQTADPKSMLSLYRALTALRRAEPALCGGAYRSVDAGDPDVFAYVREAPGSDSFLIVLNFSARPRIVDVRAAVGDGAIIAASTGMDRTGEVNPAQLTLNANEGLVLRLA
jgi:alpha-glucosidase